MTMMDGKNNSITVFMTMVMVAGILIGFFISQLTMPKSKVQVLSESKFDEVMYYINNIYVDTVKLSEIEESAIISMMDELDPHSQYISRKEFDAVNDPLLGGFEGIGVQFRIVEDTVTIVNTIMGGPS